MAREHGDDHREALRVDAGADAPGHRQVGRCDEGLDLEQQRARSLERARDRGAYLARPETGRRRSDGSGTPTSPVPVISKMPSSFVDPNRFFTARRMRCAW